MSFHDEISTLIAKERYDFEDLLCVMQILRSENGCPWDREQDHHSIRPSLIEETYEVVEAIDTDDPVLLQEELGDLLFQIVFHAQIEKEKQAFDVNDVIHDITEKMIHRHPHVFGTVAVENSDEVLQNWEVIKTEEKQRNTLVDKLRAIPPMLPALMRASKVRKKALVAAELSSDDIIDHMLHQIKTMKAVENDAQKRKEEIGKLLSLTTDLSRKWEVDAEEALAAQTDCLIEEIAKENSL